MATIYTRAGKGSALTWTEGDANVTNLNNDKMESFTLAGDSGTSQTIQGGNTLTIAGGTNLNSVASTTDTVTVNLDTTVTGLTSLTSTTLVTDTINGSTANSPIVIAPDGTGDVHLNTDSVRIGDNNADATLATRGTGDLILTTNEGAGTEGIIRIYDGANGNITLTPNGTGNLVLDGLNWPQADGTADYVLKTNGSGQLSWVAQSGGSSFDPASPGAIGGSTPAAGTFTALTANGATDTPSIVTPTTAISSTAWSTLGINLQLRNRTYTDTTHTGTMATKVANSMGTPTFASSNAMTITDAANLYLTAAPSAGTNTTITNSWALLANGRIKATAIDNTPIGSTTAAAGTFTALTASTSASLKSITEGALYDIGTAGGTQAPNVANGNVQKITLNSALTLNAFTSPVAGQSLTLIIYGGTAYTSITSTMKFAGGIKTLTATAGCIDIVSIYYDGTNYFASLGKGFA